MLLFIREMNEPVMINQVILGALFTSQGHEASPAMIFLDKGLNFPSFYEILRNFIFITQ